MADIYGTNENDVFTTEEGDIYYGGAGDDSYYVTILDQVIINNSSQYYINRDNEYNGGSLYYINNVREYEDGGFDTIYTELTSIYNAFHLVPTPQNWGVSYIENLTLTGTADIDGYGNELDNILIGNSGDNTLTGYAGSDWLDGGAGADTLIGGEGYNHYVVDNPGDTVVGRGQIFSNVDYSGGDELYLISETATTGTSTTVWGNAQNNILEGQNLYGGLGDDTYIINNSNANVFENISLQWPYNDSRTINQNNISYTYSDFGGTDEIRSSASSYTITDLDIEKLTLTGTGDINGTGHSSIEYTVADHNARNIPSSEQDILTGNSGDNTLNGVWGDDIIYGESGDDILIGGHGRDTLYGGDGNDLIWASHYYENQTVANIREIILGTVNLTAVYPTPSDFILIGVPENYWISNNLLINEAYGGAGDDVFWGNWGTNYHDLTGYNYFSGGEGDDVYHASVHDNIIENPNEGIDTLVTQMDAQDEESYTLPDNIENFHALHYVHNYYNGYNDKYVYGNNLDNILEIRYINVDGGNDYNFTLDGGIGADTLIGDTTRNIYILDNAGDTITENGEDEIDIVKSSVSYTLVDKLENITLTGSADINATGNELKNEFYGNSGINTFSGLSGDDTYYIDDERDTVIETEIITETTRNYDRVYSSADFDSRNAYIEYIELTGSDSINAIGNSVNNFIYGNSGDNTLTGYAGSDNLYGGEGADTLIGGEGADTLDGGGGADSLIGGKGNDKYWIDQVGDKVTELEDEGFDWIYFASDFDSEANYTITDNIETIYSFSSANTNITGNNLNNDIYAGSGNDILDGALGADNLYGKAGDDIYIIDNIDDKTFESWDGSGTDEVRSSVSYSISGDDIEVLTLMGSAHIDGTGNGGGNTLTGNSGNNILFGLHGNDFLYGLSGNDTLNGGTNDDTLFGGDGDDTLHTGEGFNKLYGNSGNDTYVLNEDTWPRSDYDQLIELENEGIDTVLIENWRIDYTLPDNIENAIITGTLSRTLFGNELSNELTGSSKSNILDGGLGADTLTGGDGNDTYIVDNVSDLIIELTNEGGDVVRSSVSHTLNDNVEDLIFTGNYNIDGTGNALNNYIEGNSGNNTLTGGIGHDHLAGKAGNDTYIINGIGQDTADATRDYESTGFWSITENRDEGSDHVYSSFNHNLSVQHIEYLTLTGSDDIYGYGSEQTAVTITGNSGANALKVWGANNELTGGTGIDSFEFNGHNSRPFNSINTITDFE
ncbi:hypothetical protein N8128_06950, partial [Paracoccaceae bacterium]|nr:hypothetical protein [Paracoccaceae bacterium]